MEPRFEPLRPGIFAAVSPQHRFTTDSVLLARFASPQSSDAVCDLCTGCGILPLLWFGEGESNPSPVLAVERDAHPFELLCLGVERSGLSGQITCLRADLRELGSEYAGRFDLVTCNPPYFPPGGGTDARTRQRHTEDCDFDDVCRAAARLLRFGGRFCCSHRPDHLPSLFESMRLHRLEPKRMRLVCDRPDAAPFLVLLEGRLGGGASLKAEPCLFLRDPGGNPSEEYNAIYRRG